MKPSNHQHLVRYPELGKLGLSKLTTETQFKDWCIAFYMAMDDHWAGLEDVLRKTKFAECPTTSEDFEKLICGHASRPIDC